ncbi:MAG: metal-dependent hydrolase [Flavobacteriales bacterium]|nr:metal-dependent hydrolase [Flavobacteriales bacterium]
MKLTWYGHSCMGMEVAGLQLLFDPFISGNPMAKSIKVEEVPATHVLLTHGHGDHVADAEAILKRTGAMLVGNAEICGWYEAKGIKRTTPMNIGGETDLGDCRVRLTIAQHSSTMPDGASGGDPGGFVIFTPEGNFHHAGDTGLMLDMQLLKRYKLNYACLPIGDNYTMGYNDAVEAARYMGVTTVVGMHYNTFPAVTINVEKAKDAFRAAEIRLVLPMIGETIEL